MRIGVDVDDVLFDWYGRAHEACMAAGITGSVTPFTWSPFEEYGCTAQAWYDALEVATLDGSLYSGEPLPGAVEALERLREAGHSIHLVTARGFLAHGDLIKRQTIDWIIDYRVPHDTLTFSRDKTLVRVDVFADDSERNITQLVAAGVRCCLIDADHNRHATHPWRAPSFAAFVDGLLGEPT